jgi:RNA polymerase sigma-70 factor (ECF subfamily)
VIRIRRGVESSTMARRSRTTGVDASDADLATAIGQRDPAALQEVYRRHEGCVFALARRLLIDRSLAEEVVQEVFLRFWSTPSRFDPSRGSLRSFLLAETHGRGVDLLRAEAARHRREERDALRVVDTIDLDREVEQLETIERVRAAVKALPTVERAAIELAYFGGHTYVEVAHLLDVPEGTIKSRIRSGLGRLRDEVGEEWRP